MTESLQGQNTSITANTGDIIIIMIIIVMSQTILKHYEV